MASDLAQAEQIREKATAGVAAARADREAFEKRADEETSQLEAQMQEISQRVEKVRRQVAAAQRENQMLTEIHEDEEMSPRKYYAPEALQAYKNNIALR